MVGEEEVEVWSADDEEEGYVRTADDEPGVDETTGVVGLAGVEVATGRDEIHEMVKY